MRTALGYTRISVDDEGSISLDYQDAAIREYCERNDLLLLRVETDNGISGKTITNRPAVQRVLQAVDIEEVNAVVVYKSDRMSRDGLESLQIEGLMRKSAVSYLSVTEGDLSGDSVDDEFLSFIRAGLNQRERKLISLRTKAALSRKRAKGERLGRPRYGWIVETGKLVPVEPEQEVIRRMVSLKAKSFSTREMVRALDEEGVRTRTGRPFNQTEVCRILRAG